MIKLILFSCVTLTLINISLASESNEQLINGDESNNHVQQLRLRFKRSAGKSLLSSLGSTGPNTPVVTSDSNGSGSKGFLSGLGNSEFIKQLTPEKLFSMTVGQLDLALGDNKQPAGLNKIVDFFKELAASVTSADLMKGEFPTKAMSKLLSSTGSGSGSGITDMLNNFVNRGASSDSATLSAGAPSAGSQGRQ